MSKKAFPEVYSTFLNLIKNIIFLIKKNKTKQTLLNWNVKEQGDSEQGKMFLSWSHAPTSDTTEINFPKLKESSFLENNAVIFKISVTLF